MAGMSDDLGFCQASATPAGDAARASRDRNRSRKRICASAVGQAASPRRAGKPRGRPKIRPASCSEKPASSIASK